MAVSTVAYRLAANQVIMDPKITADLRPSTDVSAVRTSLVVRAIPKCPLCSVLFFSRPRSESWPPHGRTFSVYLCPLSF